MSQLQTLTPLEAAKELQCDVAEVHELIQKGELTPNDQGIPLGQVRRVQVLRAIISFGYDLKYVEGPGNTHQPLPHQTCGHCQDKGGVVYVGSTVLEGALEYFHLIHTELRNHFECTQCGAKWGQLEFI